MKPTKFYRILVVSITSIVFLSFSTFAQTASENSRYENSEMTESDTPEGSMPFARFVSVSGDVSQQNGSSTEIRETDVNYPVMAGDRIITGSDGSCEVQYDDGTLVWLWYDTKCDFMTASAGSNESKQIKLWVGEIALRFQPYDSDSFLDLGIARINSKSGAFFRLLFNPDGSFRISVIEGEVTVSGNGNTQSVKSGTAADFDNRINQRRTDSFEPSSDVFGNWITERFQLRERGTSEAEEYIPDDKEAAAEELEGQGKWVYNVYLGCWTWAPFVPIGWVPYHHGYWDWMPGWGWTWIPDEPWGWYPYHYGYWAFYFEFGWVWVPHWRYGPHWAAWRYDGRSVSWVAIHPQDRLNNAGKLVSDAVPRNSRLQLGMQVEKSMPIEAFGIPQSANGTSLPAINAGNKWINDPPNTIKPKKSRTHIRSQSSYPMGRSSPGQGNLSRPAGPDSNRNAPSQYSIENRKSPVKNQPYKRKSPKNPTEINPSNQKEPRENSPEKSSLFRSRPINSGTGLLAHKLMKPENHTWSSLGKIFSNSAIKSVAKKSGKLSAKGLGKLLK